MIAVRIRHESDQESHYLTDVSIDELDTVIATVRAWGISTPWTDYPEEIYGQFVYGGDTDVYFEVVLGGES